MRLKLLAEVLNRLSSLKDDSFFMHEKRGRQPSAIFPLGARPQKRNPSRQFARNAPPASSQVSAVYLCKKIIQLQRTFTCHHCELPLSWSFQALVRLLRIFAAPARRADALHLASFPSSTLPAKAPPHTLIIAQLFFVC